MLTSILIGRKRDDTMAKRNAQPKAALGTDRSALRLGAESRFKGDNGALKVGEVVGYREVLGWLDFLA